MPVTRSTAGRREAVQGTASRGAECVADRGLPATSDYVESNVTSETTDTTTGATVLDNTRGTTPKDTTMTRKKATSKTSRASSKQYKLAKAERVLAKAELEAAEARIRLSKASLKMMEIESEEEEFEDSCSESDRASLVQERIEETTQAKKPELLTSARSHFTAQPVKKEVPTEEFVEKKTSGPQEGKSSLDITALAAAIAEAARGSAKYNLELPVFNGDASEWLSFKAAYRDSQMNFSKLDNLNRLRRSLRGEAKEAVSCMFLAESDPNEVMSILEARFGRPDALLLLEIEKVKKLPKLTDNNFQELCKFACKINNIVATIRALHKDHYLYNPDLVRNIIEKFNATLKYRWFDFASYRPETEPDLWKLSRFLSKESELCSKFAPPELIEDSTKNSHHKKTPSSTQHRTRTSTTSSSSGTSSSVVTCSVCGGKQHRIEEGEEFEEAAVEDRWKLAKKHGACFRCLRYRKIGHKCPYKPCGVKDCKSSHHKLLHSEENPQRDSKKEEQDKQVVASAVKEGTPRAYLKIVPVEVSGPKGNVSTFALLDEGSTVTLVEEHIAKAVGATGPKRSFSIEGVGGAHIEASESRRLELTLRGKHQESSHKVVAQTIEKLNLSPQTISKACVEKCRHLQDISSELTLDRAKPMILIGQDNWNLIVSQLIKRGSRGQPVASYTELGWVLHGVDRRRVQRVHFVQHSRALPESEKSEDIEQVIRRHFELDNIGITPRQARSEEEKRALKILEETCKRHKDGRFEAGLLWRDEEREVPESRTMAIQRLHNLERRLDRDPDLKAAYNRQMAYMIDAGYAEKATEPPQGTTWYLPHFAVVNPSKPKPRIVHDAAAKSHGVSLNDLLLPGPDLLQSLPGVLMRFRQQPVAVSADIKEMFLQIRIRPEDRDALRFLWRGDDRQGPPKEYRMTSVMFGAASSPCTAIYVKNRNAQDFEKENPNAAAAVVRNHYMDDYLQSFDNIDEAVCIAGQVDLIHRRARFQLRGWASNEPEALRIFEDDNQSSESSICLDKENKVLGLKWQPRNDTLGFNVKIDEPKDTPTKREALKIAMSIFDPLGLIAPVTIQAKHLLQETWRLGIGWDEQLPPELCKTWHAWLEELKKLEDLKIPRAHCNMGRAEDIQLHVFTDASQSAYAAAAFWRIVAPDKKVHVSLAAAKGRVAPLKVLSIPRLELQAALLGARLARHVLEEHDFAPSRRVFWTDSRTVLAWLRKGSRSFKPFVAHRLAEIEEETKVSEWRWVPTRDNVADDATRSVPPDFGTNHRWFQGPPFLRCSENDWPVEDIKTELEEPSEVEQIAVTKLSLKPRKREALPDVTRFSSWLRLIRTTGRILQFIECCRRSHQVSATRLKKQDEDPNYKSKKRRSVVRKKIEGTTTSERAFIPLEGSHILKAEKLWLQAHQEDSFREEMEAINGGRSFPSDSRLRQLSLTFVDGLIKLKGRINSAEEISEDLKTPVVLDGQHQYVRLYLKWIHQRLHHAGVEAVVNEVLQKFWVVRLRPTVKEIIKSCTPCRLRRATPPEPPTGDLPKARVAHHERPFTYTGVDYFGPLSVTIGRRHEKRWVALFTCLTTRAVHLEIAASLTTDSAIMALRRMMARRGCPKEIWSDNGTNFKGADEEMKKSVIQASKETAANYSIQWKFIPPGAPFMGGAWERMVRSVKTSLYAVLKERHPPEEVLHTLLLEVEHTLNSRPLTHVSVNPGDPAALTPNDLLLGGTSRVPIPGSFVEADTLGRKYWRHSQHLADQFWKRWLKEALPLLQKRREPHGRGHTIEQGDLVLVVDDTLPRNTWPKGIIVATYPGKDGITRTVDVKTAHGVLRRPVKKLVYIDCLK